MNPKINFRRYFLIVFGSSFLIAIILFIATSTIQSSNQTKIVQTEQKDLVQFAERQINNIFQGLESDAAIIFKNINFIKFVNSNDVSEIPHISEEFMLFLSTKRVYDQMSYFDNSGNEVIRINYNDGSPTIVSKELLQNKSHRYYFNETMDKNQGEFFISPFDLNVENGQIEEPYKPVIRLGTPIFNENGERRGAIVLNYLGKNLQNMISGYGLDREAKTMLLNSDGYWIRHDDPSKEWGFMFEDKQDVNLKTEDPEIWEIIESASGGQITSKRGIFTFEKISASKNSSEEWIILSIKDRPTTFNIASSAFNKYILFIILLLVLLLLTSASFSKLLLAKNISKEQVYQLNDMLIFINKIIRHDIKNKLTAIRFSLESFEGKDQDNSIKLAHEATLSGINLISRLKELEKIAFEKGNLQSINIKKLINSLKKEYPIEINVSGDSSVLADNALKSVFDNLINNAIKHGDTKKIDIIVSRVGINVIIDVIDYGKRISAKDKKNIFNEGFTRNPKNGTGIGLFIVKKTIERYGGEISVSDSKTKGTTFTIKLKKY